MTTKPRAITPETLGAWLLKSSRGTSPFDELVRTGFSSVTRRCVRPTYRAELIRAGQPVLLWLSGDDATQPAGIYAHGATTGPAIAREADDQRADAADPGSGTLVMPLTLTSLEPPILRSELLRHPVLVRIEVIRMAAGSNPSFLTRDQLAELRSFRPQAHAAIPI